MDCITLDDGKYSEPLPWVGFYILCASGACVLFMWFDLVHEIFDRKLWFSCKYFSLNATSLMLLAIATKLPVDISTPMPGYHDQLAKFSGTALLCISMGHFLPSLGSMEDSQVILNVIPLVIQVITVIVNVCIQMGTGVIYSSLPFHIISLSFMLIMLLITCSSALGISSMKQSLKQQHELKRQRVCPDSSVDDQTVMSAFTKLKIQIRKTLVMALSRHPGFVLRRSCLGAASDIICILEACLMLVAYHVVIYPEGQIPSPSPQCYAISDYGRSVSSIVLIQLIAVVVGALGPCLRTFPINGFLSPPNKSNDNPIQESNGSEIQVEISLNQRSVEWNERLITQLKKFIKFLSSWVKTFSVVLKVERYWTQNFVQWEHHEISLPVGVLSGFTDIGLKLLRVSPLAFVSVIKIFIKQSSAAMRDKVLIAIRKDSSIVESVDSPDTRRELTEFVLHLEGEDGLIDWIYQCCYSHTKFRSGKQIRVLLDLLKVSNVSQEFEGLARSSSTERPHCWALPLVTLTSIAAAIPCIEKAQTKSLILGVDVALKYVRLVDEKMDSQGTVSIRKAADTIWRGVSIRRQWTEVNLDAVAHKERDLNKVLEHLAKKGNSYLEEFEKKIVNVPEDKKSGMEWQPRALAGFSMHKICNSILENYGNFSTEEMFNWLQTLISDMLVCALTNLPRALSLDCFSFSFESKEICSVWEAGTVFGETEKILEALGKGDNQENQDLVFNQCKYIDHWRSFMLDPSTLPPIFSAGNV